MGNGRLFHGESFQDQNWGSCMSDRIGARLGQVGISESNILSILTGLVRWIQFDLIVCGICRGVNLHIYSPLHKLAPTFGLEADAYRFIPQGAATRATHGRLSLFTFSIPVLYGALRIMRAIVEVVD